jgi:hypothetical protein
VSQDLINLTLSEAQLSAVDNALFELETQLSGLIAMSVQQRRKLMRMGDKSESFCRQTLSVLAQNPQVVPPSLRLAAAQILPCWTPVPTRRRPAACACPPGRCAARRASPSA